MDDMGRAEAAHARRRLIEKLAGDGFAAEALADDDMEQGFADELLIGDGALALDGVNGVSRLSPQLEMLHGRKVARFQGNLGEPIDEMIGQLLRTPALVFKAYVVASAWRSESSDMW